MPRMGEGESFAGRGQGGPQAAARSAASGRHPESIIEDAKKCVCVRKSEISEDNMDVNEKNRGLMRFSIVA